MTPGKMFPPEKGAFVVDVVNNAPLILPRTIEAADLRSRRD
jgi:hypothetical protein